MTLPHAGGTFDSPVTWPLRTREDKGPQPLACAVSSALPASPCSPRWSLASGNTPSAVQLTSPAWLILEAVSPRADKRVGGGRTAPVAPGTGSPAVPGRLSRQLQLLPPSQPGRRGPGGQARLRWAGEAQVVHSTPPASRLIPSSPHLMWSLALSCQRPRAGVLRCLFHVLSWVRQLGLGGTALAASKHTMLQTRNSFHLLFSLESLSTKRKQRMTHSKLCCNQ